MGPGARAPDRRRARRPWLTQGVYARHHARKAAEQPQAARGERLARLSRPQRDIAADDLDVDAVMEAICGAPRERPRRRRDHPDAGRRRARGPRRPPGSWRTSVTRITVEGTFPGGSTNTTVGDPGRRAGGSAVGPMARELGMRSTVAVQLRHREKTVGQLIVISRERRIRSRRRTSRRWSSSRRAVVGPQPRRGVRVEAPTGGGARPVRDDLPGAAIGIALISPEGGFLDANPAFEQMFGYTDAELRDDDVARLHPPETSSAKRRCSGR